MTRKTAIKRKRTEIPAALQSIDVKAVLRRRGVYLRHRENIRLKNQAKDLAKAIYKQQKSKKTKKVKAPEPQKYTSLTNAEAKAYWEKQIHSVEVIEAHLDLAIKRFLVGKVLPAALAKLQATVDSNDSSKAQDKALKAFVKKDIFDDDEETDLQTQAQIDLEPLLQNMGVIAGQEANKVIGDKDPFVPSSALRKRIQANVEKFTKSMLDTDQQHLTDVITDGITNGDSVQQIRSVVTEDFSSYSTMQANLITRTEVLRAANQSTLDAFKQSGVVEGQQWLTAGATDECANYDGEIETLDNGFYDSGDDPFLDGEPPLHPNCRCVLIPVLSDSSDDGSGS